MKYIDWLIQWQENYMRPSVKVRTYERYRLIIEQHAITYCYSNGYVTYGEKGKGSYYVGGMVAYNTGGIFIKNTVA